MLKLNWSLTAKLVLMLAVLSAGTVHARFEPKDYKSPSFPDVENHLQVRFLPEARDWERLDIYVPKAPANEKLPCVVLVYGGGWSGKVPFSKENISRLVQEGYVVVVADYVLGAQNPVPVTLWDLGAGLRFLRKNATTYRIDPERIGVMGLSAGGWLVQLYGPSDSGTLWGNRIWGGKQPNRPKERTGPTRYVPMVEPHPANAEQSATVCAVVTDWGAKMIGPGSDWNLADPKAWLGPNDPPLFTCAPLDKDFIQKGPKAYRDAGAICEEARVGYRRKTGEIVPVNRGPADYGHCLVGVAVGNDAVTWDADGKEMSFNARTLQFLEKYVKNPEAACSPEMFPQGGAIWGQTPVVLRTVHANAAIHYTTDGTEPTKDSPLYREPIPVTAEKTLKAITIKPGLKPSPVTTARFAKAPCPPPVILTQQQVYRVKKGQPFSVTFQAKCEKPVAWHLSGQITAKVLEALDPNKDNTKVKREVAWLSLDENTGVLSGSTDRLGVNVLIVAANVAEGQAAVCDARQVIVVVDGDAASGALN
jgi:hypothetical protein